MSTFQSKSKAKIHAPRPNFPDATLCNRAWDGAVITPILTRVTCGHCKRALKNAGSALFAAAAFPKVLP